MPDKKRKLETKIKRRTLNPRWNETFYFEGETYTESFRGTYKRTANVSRAVSKTRKYFFKLDFFLPR